MEWIAHSTSIAEAQDLSTLRSRLRIAYLISKGNKQRVNGELVTYSLCNCFWACAKVIKHLQAEFYVEGENNLFRLRVENIVSRNRFRLHTLHVNNYIIQFKRSSWSNFHSLAWVVVEPIIVSYNLVAHQSTLLRHSKEWHHCGTVFANCVLNLIVEEVQAGIQCWYVDICRNCPARCHLAFNDILHVFVKPVAITCYRILCSWGILRYEEVLHEHWADVSVVVERTERDTVQSYRQRTHVEVGGNNAACAECTTHLFVVVAVYPVFIACKVILLSRTGLGHEEELHEHRTPSTVACACAYGKGVKT